MLKIYLILPFIFSFIFGIFTFLKNPIYIRRIFYTFSFIQFIFSFFCLLFIQNSEFSLFNIDFAVNNISLIFSFITSFILFLVSILSKTFIKKLHRLFSCSFILLSGLINLFLFCDNIFINLITIFWIFLIQYLISYCDCEKNKKHILNIRLTIDISILLIAVFLIGWDFCRYFIANDIGFNFLNIEYNLINISDISSNCAFFGFLILCAKFFNLILFSDCEIKSELNINPLTAGFNSLLSLILGSFLLYKTYANFDYLFYQNQKIIIIYLTLNLFYYLILSLNLKNLFKFLKNSLVVFILSAIIPLFIFNDDTIGVFLYYILSLIFSFALCFFIAAIFKDKFKSYNIEDFPKIDDSKKSLKIFFILSFLNLSKMPFFSFFTANLFVFTTLFSKEYESIILNIAPYCFLISAFISTLTFYNVIYKILIDTNNKNTVKFSLSHHYLLALGFLAFAIILLSINPQYIIELLSGGRI